MIIIYFDNLGVLPDETKLELRKQRFYMTSEPLSAAIYPLIVGGFSHRKTKYPNNHHVLLTLTSVIS